MFIGFSVSETTLEFESTVDREPLAARRSGRPRPVRATIVALPDVVSLLRARFFFSGALRQEATSRVRQSLRERLGAAE